MTRRAALPIDALLPALGRVLAERGCAVVVAPPGTGKTTRVPPYVAELIAAGALGPDLDRDGRVVVLQPRRVAARATAARMAAERGEPVGASVGYQVRFERRISARTRIEVLTEGLLLRRVAADPLLEGVAAVVIDELHERSLDVDLAIALVAEVRREVRDDLRIVAMSATLDAEPVAAFLGGAAILRADAPRFEVALRWDDHVSAEPLADRVALAVAELCAELGGGTAEAPGHVLVFLPGGREIADAERAIARLRSRDGRLAHLDEVLPLHGGLPAAAQDRAIAPAPRRKVVLATDIAETSLTIDGLAAVVDSGWRKRPRLDEATGLDRLVRERISAASAAQRLGRAGRQAAGLCRRLYTPAEMAAFTPYDRAELHRADLSGAALQLRAWGANPRTFGWLEAPSPAALDAADATLEALGALEGGQLTAVGRAMAALPLPPRVARVMVAGVQDGEAKLAAAVCALASERDVMREVPTLAGESDLELRLHALEAARAARYAPATLARWGLDAAAARRFWQLAEALERAGRAGSVGGPGRDDGGDDGGDIGGGEGRAGGGAARPKAAGTVSADARVGRWLAAGFPDRVAQRRQRGGGRLLLANGKGAQLDERSVVRDADFVVAVVLEAGRRGERAEANIRVAVAIDPAALPARTQLETRWDGDRLAVVQVHCRRYRSLLLSERPAGPDGDAAAIEALLADKARRDPARALSLDARASALVARIRWLARLMPELALPTLAGLDGGGPALAAIAEADAAPDVDARGRAAADGSAAEPDLFDVLARGRRGFDELRRAPVADALMATLSWPQQQALARWAPTEVALPSGGRAAIRYDDAGATASLRLQDAFGWTETPALADGRARLRVELLAPNGRPAQVTSDLARFWLGAWAEVRRELRGRYPKHAWPERPTLADARRPRPPRPPRERG